MPVPEMMPSSAELKILSSLMESMPKCGYPFITDDGKIWCCPGCGKRASQLFKIRHKAKCPFLAHSKAITLLDGWLDARSIRRMVNMT